MPTGSTPKQPDTATQAELGPVWEAEGFDSSLAATVQALGGALGWAYVEAWVPDSTDLMLELIPTWYGSGEELKAFHTYSLPLLTPKGVGVCGRTWESGRSEWIEDVGEVPVEEFLRGQHAAAAGLRGAFGVPVRSGRRTAAVLIFFSSASETAPPVDTARTQAWVDKIAPRLCKAFREQESASRRQELVYDSQSDAARELVRQIVGDVIPLLSVITEWSERCTNEILELDADSARVAAVATGSRAITAAARRARGLTRRLAPLVALTPDAATEDVDVNAVVRTVITALRPMVPRGTRLTAHLDPSAPQIHARRREFERCMFCLLQNAIEAVARTGEPRGEVSVTTSFRDGSIEVLVHDTGCGLTSIVAENMGSPLFSTKEHGLGMGLFLARKVVESIGGRLSGQTNPDRGATFRIAVPV